MVLGRRGSGKILEYSVIWFLERKFVKQLSSRITTLKLGVEWQEWGGYPCSNQIDNIFCKCFNIIILQRGRKFRESRSFIEEGHFFVTRGATGITDGHLVVRQLENGMK